MPAIVKDYIVLALGTFYETLRGQTPTEESKFESRTVIGNVLVELTQGLTLVKDIDLHLKNVDQSFLEEIY